MEIKFPNIKVQLTGCDGNAFAILGKCQRAMRSAGCTNEQIEEFITEAQSGDYDELLQACMKWFDIR